MDEPKIQFCSQCYFIRAYTLELDGKERQRYVCVCPDGERRDRESIDYFNAACASGKPKSWRPDNIKHEP